MELVHSNCTRNRFFYCIEHKTWKTHLLSNMLHIYSSKFIHKYQLIQLKDSLCRTFCLVIDKLSITTVIFIRSKNKHSITMTYMYPGTSECMLWIQSMLRLSLQLTHGGIGGNGLLLCVCAWPLLLFNLRPGVFKRTLSHIWLKLNFTYIPIEGGVVESNVNGFFY